LRAEPSGDYNTNEVVDAANYVLWRNTLGQMNVPVGSSADGIATGNIDDGDFTHWRARFGNTLSGAFSAGFVIVPEPSIAAYFVFGPSVMVWRLKRRRA
jgi:hypothetical protein